MFPRGYFSRMMGGGDGDDSPSISIQKAENGYIVTISPAVTPEMEMAGFSLGRRPEPHEIEQLQQARQKAKSRVFVFADIDKAWAAIKEFFMDGRMPQQP